MALCGIAKSDITTTTFTSVTIDGQAATQVGSTIRQADSGGNGAVVAMFRATGTSSTTVTVAFNVTSTGSVGLFDHRGALWTLNVAAAKVPWYPIFNAIGQPAASVPAGFDAAGLPLAVQLAGRPNDEATLLSLAAQIERERPWADRRPEL